MTKQTTDIYYENTELPAGNFLTSEGNVLISSINPGILTGSLEGRSDYEIEKTLGKRKPQLIRSFGTEDNPILFFTYLKD